MKTDSANLGIELWPIEKIQPYKDNAKKHSETQVDSLVKSIAKFGWTQPIVIDTDGVIIAGHGRRLAAIKLGLKKIPVVCRKDLSKAEADALRLADNRIASTEYDFDLVQSELRKLYDEGFEVEFTGFSDAELTFLTGDLATIDQDIFIEDVTEAVEEQREGNKSKAKEIDESASPLVDAFGFKRITVAQSRKIRAFMTRIESETGKKGVDALMQFLEGNEYV